MSLSSAFRSETEYHEFGGSPMKLTSPTARNPTLNFHKNIKTSWSGEKCQQLELDLCFLRTNVTAAVYQEVLEYFLLPTTEQLFGGDEFTFQHDLAPAHNAKSTKTWFTTYGIQVRSWLANSSSSSSSSFGYSHSGVATADAFQTSAQNIWQCFTPDALPDATYY